MVVDRPTSPQKANPNASKRTQATSVVSLMVSMVEHLSSGLMRARAVRREEGDDDEQCWLYEVQTQGPPPLRDRIGAVREVHANPRRKRVSSTDEHCVEAHEESSVLWRTEFSSIHWRQHQEAKAAPARKEAARREHGNILSSNNEHSSEGTNGGIDLDTVLAAEAVKYDGYYDHTDDCAGLACCAGDVEEVSCHGADEGVEEVRVGEEGGLTKSDGDY